MINKYYHRKNIYGFSMIELLTALAIAAILVAYAIPSYRTFLLRQQINNQVNNLVTDLTFAKVTAVNMTQQVVVQSKTGNDWSNGWWIYVNSDGDTNRLGAGDIILRDEDASNGSIEMATSAATVAGTIAITGGEFFVFDSIGSSPSGVNSIDIKHAELPGSTSVDISLSGTITSTKN